MCVVRISSKINLILKNIKVWNVKADKRYICVGTWGYKKNADSPVRGRVLVYNLKKVSREQACYFYIIFVFTK